MTNDRIISTPGTVGGKPRIKGRRIAVQHIAVWHYQMGQSVGEIAREYDLDEADVIAALDYYATHKAEIDARIAEEDRMLRGVEAAKA